MNPLKKTRSLLPALAILTCTSAHAATTFLTGGVTSVDLDTQLLTSAAGLTLTSVAGTAPAAGGFAVGFDINSRGGSASSTTFSFDDTTVTPFSGTIEHTGTITFNGGTPAEVTVGDLRIGFDNARVAGMASGFFVESTTGFPAILFDIGTLSPVPSPTSLTITGTAPTGGANLFVSPELAAALQSEGFTTDDLTGADVGSARLDGIAAVPEPSASILALAGIAGLALRRRR